MKITFGDMAESLANLRENNIFDGFSEQEILRNAIRLKKLKSAEIDTMEKSQ